MQVSLREYTESDTTDVLRLNAESVAVLSSMDHARFRTLAAMSAILQVADADGEVVGFFMAFTDGREYDSVNYQWFASRLKRFLYIDHRPGDARSITPRHGDRLPILSVGRAVRPEGRKAGLAWLVAEVDVVPPNPASLAFHDRQGFVEVERQEVGGGKVVSLRVKSLDHEPSAATDRAASRPSRGM